MPDREKQPAEADEWLLAARDLFAIEPSVQQLSPANWSCTEGRNLPDVDLDALCEIILSGIARPGSKPGTPG